MYVTFIFLGVFVPADSFPPVMREVLPDIFWETY